jgi:hypothetical protein
VSSTYSQSYSYTVTDISKVFDQVRADLHMASQSTRLWSDTLVNAVADDLRQYAAYGYLELVAVYLRNRYGTPVRAATYTVSQNAAGWTASRPGNMLWPRLEGASLRVTISLSATWYALSTTKQEAFQRGLRLEWPTTGTQDLRFPNLASAPDRCYVSNGFGLQKDVFR